MGYPTFAAQQKCQEQAIEQLKELRKTNPEKAKRISLMRLRRAGIVDESGGFTQTFLDMWSDGSK